VTSRPRDPAAVGGRVGLGGDGRGVLIEKEEKGGERIDAAEPEVLPTSTPTPAAAERSTYFPRADRAFRRGTACLRAQALGVIAEGCGLTVAVGAEEGADVVEPEVGNRTGGERDGTPSAGRRSGRKKLFNSTIQSENR
jgi:hypothetical protein